jgi:hypothetical protein
MDKKLLLERATLCGEWMLTNQVTDRLDANRGRCIRCYGSKSGVLGRTGNWLVGSLCMSLCALYRRTGEEKYLRAAEYAGHYILSLQVMDARQTRYYGAIREITPQSIEFAPRDATTAGWALVWLYRTTKNPLYLDHAILFGEWHMQHGMLDGWPLYACFMDPAIDDFYAQGSFQSGTGLFYHDLFLTTGDARFIEDGFRPIAVNYRDRFIHEDGHVIQERAAFTGEITSREPPPLQDKSSMHLYNDDFGAAMLLAAADFFKDETFRESARRHALWLAGMQNSEGSFGELFPSGVPVSLMTFDDLGHDEDAILSEARDKALEKLLSMQCRDTGDPMLDGAFRGAFESYTGCIQQPDEICVHMRTTGYALMALLKLESELPDIWLGRHNPRFADPVHTGALPNLIW